MRVGAAEIMPIKNTQGSPGTTRLVTSHGTRNLDKVPTECRRLVEESVRRNIGDSLLLSGGLDTTILAHVAAGLATPKCYTVIFPYGPTPDVYYAKNVAKKLRLKWELVKLTASLLRDRLGDVIRILRTFDPMEVRNSVAVYHGLAAANSQGFSRVMTGDAADELFAGYSFTFNLKSQEIMRRLRELWKIMHFSSQPMAEALGIEASLPYLDSSVVEFAKSLGPEHLVGSRNGKKYGKLVLRIAFEEVIGKKSAWRVKTPIEFGSGTTSLPAYYSGRISDSEFGLSREDIASRDRVKIRDKEHLEYYRLYRTTFPSPREAATTEYRCPDCGADINQAAKFCVTCGAYPIHAVSTNLEFIRKA